VANGRWPVKQHISGIDKKHFYTAQQILMGDECLLQQMAAGNVLIIGGGAVGLETALYFIRKVQLEMQSKQFLKFYTDSKTSEGLKCNSNITIVEMNHKMGEDLKSTRWITLSELERSHVRLMNGTKVERILEKEVVVSHEDTKLKIDADYIVLATGYRSEGDQLIQWLIENSYEFKVIGDAKVVGTISNALSDAYILNE